MTEEERSQFLVASPEAPNSWTSQLPVFKPIEIGLPVLTNKRILTYKVFFPLFLPPKATCGDI